MRVGAIAAPLGHSSYELDDAGACTCACGYVAERRRDLRPHYDFVGMVSAMGMDREDLLAWCERQIIAIAAGVNETGHAGEVALYGMEIPIARLAVSL